MQCFMIANKLRKRSNVRANPHGALWAYIILTSKGSFTLNAVPGVVVQCRRAARYRTAPYMVWMSLNGAITHTHTHTHTHAALGWDEMGWVALVTHFIIMEAFTHWVTSAAHPIPSQRSVCVCLCVCVCVNVPYRAQVWHELTRVNTHT